MARQLPRTVALLGGTVAALALVPAVGAHADSPTTIGGRIWFDRNSDGIYQSVEPGAPGVQVDLYRVGTVAPIASTVTGSQTISSAGRYSFAVAPGSSYYFAAHLPSGYGFTVQGAPGSGKLTDSNYDPGTATSSVVVVKATSPLDALNPDYVDVNGGLVPTP